MSVKKKAVPWLHVVGIGEDGMAGLSSATRVLVEAAEVIVGGSRHHDLSPDVTAQRLAWPSPFDAMIETLRGATGQSFGYEPGGDAAANDQAMERWREWWRVNAAQPFTAGRD